MARAFKAAGADVTMVWHKDSTLPEGVDIVGVPGGFSYGDYLRCGAIAAQSPITKALAAHVQRGWVSTPWDPTGDLWQNSEHML